MHAKRLVLAFALGLASAAAHAGCYGYGSTRTCTDPNTGSTCTTQRFGNQPYTHGYKPRMENTWNSSTNRFSDSAFTDGIDIDGKHWSTSTHRLGNTAIVNGYDSNGNAIDGTSTRIGNTRTTTIHRSDGTTVTRTCNACGCF